MSSDWIARVGEGVNIPSGLGFVTYTDDVSISYDVAAHTGIVFYEWKVCACDDPEGLGPISCSEIVIPPPPPL